MTAIPSYACDLKKHTNNNQQKPKMRETINTKKHI